MSKKRYSLYARQRKMLFGTISAKTGVLRSKIPVFAQPARRLSAIQSDFRVLEAKKTAAICNGACSNYFSREAKKKGNSFSAPASTQKTKRKTRRPAIRRANGLVVIHIRVASYIPGSIPGWLAPLRSYTFLPSFLPPSLPVARGFFTGAWVPEMILQPRGF